MRHSIITLWQAEDGQESPDLKTPLLKQSPIQNLEPHGNLVVTPAIFFAYRRPRHIRERSRPPAAQLQVYAHVVLTLGILALATLGALFVPNIGVVMAFIGSTILPAVCYVFPTLALWRLRQIVPKHFIPTKLLAIVTFSGLLATVTSVLGIVQ